MNFLYYFCKFSVSLKLLQNEIFLSFSKITSKKKLGPDTELNCFHLSRNILMVYKLFWSTKTMESVPINVIKLM